MKRAFVLTIAAIVISACGPKGSNGWHKFAKNSEIDSWYDSFSVNELCYRWNKDLRESRRERIGESLKRRGLDYFHCYNAQNDRLLTIEEKIDRSNAGEGVMNRMTRERMERNRERVRD